MKNYKSNKLKMSKKSLYISVAFVVISTILIVVVSFKRSFDSDDSVTKFGSQISQTQKPVRNIKKDNSGINTGRIVEEYLERSDTAKVENDKLEVKSETVKAETKKVGDSAEKKPLVSKPKGVVKFINPVEGTLLQKFSGKELVFSETLHEYRTHNGVDIETLPQSSVKAVGEGKVTNVVNDAGIWGTCVEIEHDDGVISIYRGLNKKVNVKIDSQVKRGEIIGTVAAKRDSLYEDLEFDDSDEGDHGNVFEGALPCHLHFEIMKDGEFLDPLEYVKY